MPPESMLSMLRPGRRVPPLHPAEGPGSGEPTGIAGRAGSLGVTAPLPVAPPATGTGVESAGGAVLAPLAGGTLGCAGMLACAGMLGCAGMTAAELDPLVAGTALTKGVA